MDNKVDFIQKEDGYVLYVDKSPYLVSCEFVSLLDDSSLSSIPNYGERFL